VHLKTAYNSFLLMFFDDLMTAASGKFWFHHAKTSCIFNDPASPFSAT